MCVIGLWWVVLASLGVLFHAQKRPQSSVSARVCPVAVFYERQRRRTSPATTTRSSLRPSHLRHVQLHLWATPGFPGTCSSKDRWRSRRKRAREQEKKRAREQEKKRAREQERRGERRRDRKREKRTHNTPRATHTHSDTEEIRVVLSCCCVSVGTRTKKIREPSPFPTLSLRTVGTAAACSSDNTFLKPVEHSVVQEDVDILTLIKTAVHKTEAVLQATVIDWFTPPRAKRFKTAAVLASNSH